MRTVLIIPFVLQIVVTVGLVGYLSYRNGQQAVNDIASQLRTEIGDRTLEHIRTYLRTIVPNHQPVQQTLNFFAWTAVPYTQLESQQEKRELLCPK